MNPEELRQRLTLIVAETPVDQCWTLSTTHLLKLVEDAVEAEREACAKLCEWVGLTEADIYEAMDFDDEFEFAKAIEAKLKEKNCG